MKLFSAIVMVACGVFLQASAGLAAQSTPSTASAPSPKPGGKSVSTHLPDSDSVGETTAVKPLAPEGAPGGATGALGPEQQSSVGAGMKIHFGGHAKPSPLPEEDSDAD